MPQDTIIGCYVPVAIRVRGILSNQATLSINKDPYACAHPLGLTYSDLKTLDAGGAIPLADASVNRDSNPVVGSAEGASLTFLSATAANVALQSGVQTTDAQTFSCFSANPMNGTGYSQLGLFPNPGALTISGPGGKQLQLLLKNGSFSGDAPADNPPYFSAGLWQLAGSGGSDLGAFQQNFTLPPSLNLTNLDNSTIIPSPGYTLRWDGSGFAPGDIVTVFLQPTGDFTKYASCTAPAWSGQLLLPNSILDAFKGRSASIFIQVRPNTTARTLFSIPSDNGEPIHGFIDYSFLQRFTTQIQ